MFSRLDECIGKEIVIKYWKDGELTTYEGVLNMVVNYRYILIDRKNFLLFLAANGAIGSITCDGELVYETAYAHQVYEPIEQDDIEKELEKRELDCFDEEYKEMQSRSTEEYFLKRGKELLPNKFYVKWERFIKENINIKYALIKAIIDIVDYVENGNTYYAALAHVFGEIFDYSLKEIEEVNDVILDFFFNDAFDYTDFAVFMLQHGGIKKLEENNNMKQLINTHNVYVSLAK